jgi:hypothetical protein
MSSTCNDSSHIRNHKHLVWYINGMTILGLSSAPKINMSTASQLTYKICHWCNDISMKFWLLCPQKDSKFSLWNIFSMSFYVNVWHHTLQLLLTSKSRRPKNQRGSTQYITYKTTMLKTGFLLYLWEILRYVKCCSDMMVHHGFKFK